VRWGHNGNVPNAPKRIALALSAREYVGRGADRPKWHRYRIVGDATRTLCEDCALEVLETIRTFFRELDAKDEARGS